MSKIAAAPRRVPTAAVVILVAAAVGVAGLVAGSALTNGGDPVSRPVEGSAEAGFARDMQAHHAQAVQMSTMVRDATEDPEVRSLALDIMLTQQQQAGQMYGWLEQWDLPQASLAAPMQWMTDPGAGTMDHGDDTTTRPASDAVMPGMATQEDLEQLDEAVDVDAEIRYLRLMVAHHQGGVAMAQAALDLVQDDDVRRLAQAIVSSQTAELTVLNDMLDERESASAGQ
ncbi:DUF305 domain-containing protein [Cellulomonas sp. APG4]|uniref:DUF305 domain-containing protein n=1 Tax=Cellulomonas sp. APG4 TaxID=1538656 RepID=UPI001379E137|nr:DUF305 domain-containing protein [Cellulomonas sp. APG4]NCT89496.1 DUF305 domain-containing protein [Cellulomonas sp. APG4]